MLYFILAVIQIKCLHESFRRIELLKSKIISSHGFITRLRGRHCKAIVYFWKNNKIARPCHSLYNIIDLENFQHVL